METFLARRRRDWAASIALALMAAGICVGCSSDAGERPVEPSNPTTPASSAPQSPTSVPMRPTEKEMLPNSPNSFSPSLKAPTPYSPTPCLPFCD